MSRAHEKATTEVLRAEEQRAKWAGKLQAGQERLVGLEGAAGANLLDDPAAESRLPRELDAAASQVRAFERAHATADARWRDARRRALLTEAVDEDSAADRLEKDASAVARKVADALDALEAVSGVRYELPCEEHIRGRLDMGERVVLARPQVEILTAQARVRRVRAAVLRGTAERGSVPQFGHELDGSLPGLFASAQLVDDEVPDSAKAYASEVCGPA